MVRLMCQIIDLDFVDDLTLLSNTKAQIQENTNYLNNESQSIIFKIHQAKRKVMRFNTTKYDPMYIEEK